MIATEQITSETCDTCGKPTSAEDLFSEQPCGVQVCRGCLDAYLVTASTEASLFNIPSMQERQ